MKKSTFEFIKKGLAALLIFISAVPHSLVLNAQETTNEIATTSEVVESSVSLEEDGPAEIPSLSGFLGSPEDGEMVVSSLLSGGAPVTHFEDDRKSHFLNNQLRVEESTGAFTYTIPIVTPPGRNGIEPDLFLMYNSQSSKNEYFGKGWSINIPYIERINRTGSENLYENVEDYFYSSFDGELRATTTSAIDGLDFAIQKNILINDGVLVGIAKTVINVLLGTPKIAHAGSSTPVKDSLQRKNAKERARVKGEEIAKIKKIARTTRGDYSIQVLDMKAVPTGVEIFARVWNKKGEQIGFGKDGSVDIERFVMINPPILVPDKNGGVKKSITDSVTGKKHTFTYREDLREAVLLSLEHTVKVKEQKFGDENIVRGRVGNTTTTIYPDGSPESTSVDGQASFDGYQDTWANVRGAATADTAGDTETQSNGAYTGKLSSPTRYYLYRAFFLFDTSSIGGDTVDSATFSMYPYAKVSGSSSAAYVSLVSSSPASNTAITTADYDQVGTTKFATDINTSSVTINTYNNWALNGSGLNNINSSGVSKFALRHGNDIENVDPTSGGYNGINGITWADYTGTTEDPKLVVEHSGVPESTATDFGPIVEEGDFRKYEYVDRDYWEVTDKSGTIYIFGESVDARQSDSNNASSTFKWMLQEIRDTDGNYITFEYFKDNGQIYPDTITYTGNNVTDGPFEVVFGREYNPDIATSTATGFPVRTYYKIDEIQAKVNGNWVRKYDLTYTNGSQGVNLLLASSTESGRDVNGNITTLPTTNFEYNTGFDIDWVLDQSYFATSTTFSEFTFLDSDFSVVDRGQRVNDVNGDGYSDFLLARTGTEEVFVNNTEGSWVDKVSGGSYTIPEDFVEANYSDRYLRTIEVNGDFLPDLVISLDNGTSTTQSTFINDGDGTGWTDRTTNHAIPVLFYDDAGDGDNGIRIADVNGDGLQDLVSLVEKKVYVNRGEGSGWELDLYYILPTPGQELELVLTDINNDQLDDIVFSSATSTGSLKQVYINKGDGTGWQADANYSIPIFFYNNDMDQGVRMIDVNNDDYVDIVQSGILSATSGPSRIYLNDGNGTGWTLYSSSQPPVYFSDFGVDKGVRFIDPNGDGVIDLVFSYEEYDGSPIERKLYLNGGGNASTKATRNPDLLNKVTDSSGLITGVSYLPTSLYRDGSNDLLNPNLPLVLDTVQYISVRDSLGTTGTTTYSYGGGEYYHASSTQRRFAGFATTTIADPVGNVTKVFFHQGNGSQTAIGEYNDIFSKIGKVYRVEEYDNTNTLYRKTVTKWDHVDLANGRDYIKQVRKVTYAYDGDSDHKDVAIEHVTNDANGNLSERVEYGEVTGSDDGTFSDSGSDKRTTTYKYATSTPDYIIGVPSHETVRNNGGTTVAEKRFYYDGQALGSVTDGNLTKEEQLVSGSTYIDVEHTYNGYGLVTQDKDPRDKTTAYVYDPYNLYVATSTNAKSHVTEFYYDYSSGKVATTTDPNDRVFVTVYDGLDRALEEKVPDPANPSSLVVKNTYEYTDTAGSKRILQTTNLNSSTSTLKYTYLDAHGRPIQERIEMEDVNTFTVKDSAYDKRGNVATTSLPYAQGGTTRTSITTDADLLIAHTYDALGRVKTITNTLGAESYAYDQWETVVTDREGNTKDLLNDAFGNLVQVDEHNSASTYSTVYTYDARNNLTKITDANDNVRNFTYDSLSRLTKSEDLHDIGDSTFGSTTMAYDASGNITEKTDPKNQTVSYTYDDINRALSENYLGGSGTEVEYGYDSCTEGVGRLCVATTTDAVSEYVYNALGGIATETRTIDGEEYTTSFTYDRLGNQLTVTYPDTSAVSYVYNSAGQLEKIGFTDVGTQKTFLVEDLDYGPTGQVTYKLFGNNVESLYNYSDDELYRLNQIITVLGGGVGGSIDNVSLEQGESFTADGNIVSETISTAIKDIIEIFKSPIPTEESVSVGVESLLKDKTSDEKAALKGLEIAKLESISRTPREKYDIEIVSMNPISGGVEVFARAWDKDGEQIGFGKNGTVDMERFRIINPPVLVDDPKGSIVRTYTDKGETFTYNLREDAKEALLQVIEHNLSVMKNVHGSTNIRKGKVGRTTSTFYPAAGSNAPVDGVIYREGVNEGFTTIAAGNGTGAEATDTISSAPEVDASVGLTDQFKGNRRSIWGFDTSSIPDADTVSSATFSLVVNSNANTLGNFDVYITPASPSSASSLTSSDYQNAFTRTSYGSKALSTYTDNNSTYNDIALNGTGVSAISKTSNTFLGGMHSWDFNQSFTGTWVSNSESRLRPRFADETGTAKDPKLVVEHTAAEEGSLQDISYTYDTVGNITNMLDVSETGTGKTVVFGYDDLYRLTSASTTAATSTPYTQTYTYNALGNILTKSDQGTYTYGETGYTNPHAATDVNGTTLVYDNNGNLTSFGTKGYLWDYRNRMTASGQTGTATTTYAYDHTVQRVWKVTGNATTTYPNMYFDTKGATTTRHIFDTTGVLVATVEGNGIATSTNYIHTDHLGGTNVVTDSNGEAVQVLDYYPYGNERISSGTDSADRHYIGERFDDESDLSYLNARYYQSARGQFLSQDPVFWEAKQNLQNPQSLNSYSYAEGNPILKKDPSGRCPICVLGLGLFGGYLYGIANQYMYDQGSGQMSSLSTYNTSSIRGMFQGGAVAGSLLVLGPATAIEYYSYYQTYQSLHDFNDKVLSNNSVNYTEKQQRTAGGVLWMDSVQRIASVFTPQPTKTAYDAANSILNSLIQILSQYNASETQYVVQGNATYTRTSGGGLSPTSLPAIVSQGDSTYYRNSSGLLSTSPGL